LVVPLLWVWLGAETFPEVLALGLLLGVAGASFAVALPLASRWYPPESQGIAMGIAGAGNSGTVIAVLLAPRLAREVGWHDVFGLAILPVLLTLVAFMLLAREVPDLPKPVPVRTAFRILHEPDLWWFGLFYSITFGGFVGLASFLGIFFHDQYGVGRVMAGNLTALCVLAGSGFRPVGGYLSDRIGGLRLLPWLYGLVAIALGLVGSLPPLGAAVAILIGAMTVLGMGNGAVFQMVPQRFREDIGLVSGLIGAAGGIGGFLLPSLLGGFKDLTGSYGVGFFVFAGLAVSCGLILLRYRTRWQDTWTPEAVAAAVERQAGRVRMEVMYGG
jgi:NNP family nitrate/nitrite transporter-like MFS transporter